MTPYGSWIVRKLVLNPLHRRGKPRSFLALLLGVCLSALFAFLPAALWARPAAMATGLETPFAIPITEQPFFSELQSRANRWRDFPLGAVVGESPRDTLLNFYVVMALVNQEIGQAIAQPHQDPGLGWSDSAKERIHSAETLFALAEHALDASTFPQSVRDDMRAEAALQLKEILDFVFTHSSLPIEIPDAAEMKVLNSRRSKPSQSWLLPETSIVLTTEQQDPDDPPGYLFSADTVAHIARMYENIKHRAPVNQPFATQGLVSSYILTPGHLVPPKWYVKLSPGLRRLLEVSIFGQTILQVLAAVVILIVYVTALSLLLRLLLQTYRYWRPSHSQQTPPWHQDNKAWYRVVLIIPLIPLTKVSDLLIDDYINITGMPLVVVTYLLFVVYFLTLSGFVFYLLEAIGRSLSELIVQARGESTDLQLRRVSNLVMPVSRVIGALIAIILIYQLLIQLGMPQSTVLAFSAVPGLAIGLGASKLLGNLFAGLSIQTDRPVRVGEFCKIGHNLGFVTKIGLRSLELQTLESRVTIPNAIADEETIINYSRRSDDESLPPLQALEVRFVIDRPLVPEQVNDVLRLVRCHVESDPQLINPVVSLDQACSDQFTLVCVALLRIQDWGSYLSIRENLLKSMQALVAQVSLSVIKIGVSYDTTAEQLRAFPALVAGVAHHDPELKMRSCRLMTIGDFSYQFAIGIEGSQQSLTAFKDALDQFNKRLLIALAQAGIEIPYPTAIEIQRQS